MEKIDEKEGSTEQAPDAAHNPEVTKSLTLMDKITKLQNKVSGLLKNPSDLMKNIPKMLQSFAKNVDYYKNAFLNVIAPAFSILGSLGIPLNKFTETLLGLDRIMIFSAIKGADLEPEMTKDSMRDDSAAIKSMTVLAKKLKANNTVPSEKDFFEELAEKYAQKIGAGKTFALKDFATFAEETYAKAAEPKQTATPPTTPPTENKPSTTPPTTPAP